MPLLRRQAHPSRFRGQGLRRRAALALVAGVGGAAWLGAPILRRVLTPEPAYEPIPGLDGFRRVASGSVSGGNPALQGIDAPRRPATMDTICAHLFDAPLPEGPVPIAYFSDARCVFCRELSPLLHEIEDSAPVAVTWHEYPLLGPASQRAARATVAAGMQGAQRAFHDRLMGTPFLPNDAYLRELATEAGINPDRLLRDMASDAVTVHLERTARVGRAFGFRGTPALVVGRTAVLGQVSERRLRALVAQERRADAPFPCRRGRVLR